MPTLVRKTSSRWCKILGINTSDIVNPIGWNTRDGFHYSFYNELVSLNRFKQRLNESELAGTALEYIGDK